MDILYQYFQEVGWEIFFICIRILIVLLLAWVAIVNRTGGLVEIPFPHQTLYFGEASKPIEVALLEKLKGKNHS